MASPSSYGKRSRSSSPASDPYLSSTKRTKVDEEVEQMLQVSQDPRSPSSNSSPQVYDQSETQIVRDDTYYMADGSCILQVENTLFNIHRTLLAKDSSLFSTMFELPQGDHDVDGRTDSNPIYLNGETVAEFKNFLWVLYALPHELSQITSPQIDLDRLNRLVDIARVSFKYHFKSIETWSLDVITEHVKHKPSPSIFCIPTLPSSVLSGSLTATSIASSAMNTSTASVTTPQAIAANGALVSRLMRLAQLCGHERLLNTMITVLRQLMTYSIRYAHLAMTLADELDLRALRGIAYFEVMQKAHVVVSRSPPRSPTTPGSRSESPEAHQNVVDEEGRLVVSHEQKLRLLTGYYRLTMVWERLRATPLPLEHSAACSATWHQHGCTQCWLDFWKDKTKSESVLALGLADVLGRLRAIGKEFGRWGSATYMHTDCRAIARKMISDKVKLVEDSLADYFVDDGLRLESP